MIPPLLVYYSTGKFPGGLLKYGKVGLLEHGTVCFFGRMVSRTNAKQKAAKRIMPKYRERGGK